MKGVSIKKLSFYVAYFLFVAAFLFFSGTSGIVEKNAGFDFMAFVTGSKIITTEGPENLYNITAQKNYQMGLLKDFGINPKTLSNPCHAVIPNTTINIGRVKKAHL